MEPSTNVTHRVKYMKAKGLCPPPPKKFTPDILEPEPWNPLAPAPPLHHRRRRGSHRVIRADVYASVVDLLAAGIAPTLRS
jgi:hypothetical protein